MICWLVVYTQSKVFWLMSRSYSIRSTFFVRQYSAIWRSVIMVYSPYQPAANKQEYTYGTYINRLQLAPTYVRPGRDVVVRKYIVVYTLLQIDVYVRTQMHDRPGIRKKRRKIYQFNNCRFIHSQFSGYFNYIIDIIKQTKNVGRVESSSSTQLPYYSHMFCMFCQAC